MTLTDQKIKVFKKAEYTSTIDLLSDSISNKKYKKAVRTKFASSELKYKKVIRDIETNNIYDTSVLINDLKNIPEIKAHKGFFTKLIESIFGTEDRPQKTDLEWLISEMENTQLPLSKLLIQDGFKYEELEICYTEFREYFLTNKEELLITLKNNTLKRVFKNETKNKIYQKLSKLSPGIPLMMRLREFLNNIFSVKKAILNYLRLQIANAFLTLKILYYGNKKQNRIFMLAY